MAGLGRLNHHSVQLQLLLNEFKQSLARMYDELRRASPHLISGYQRVVRLTLSFVLPF